MGIRSSVQSSAIEVIAINVQRLGKPRFYVHFEPRMKNAVIFYVMICNIACGYVSFYEI
jgi:hypothetical protein